MPIVYKPITGRDNSAVCAAAKLSERKYRLESGRYTVGGRKLVQEAADAGILVSAVFATASFRAAHPELCARLEEKYPNAAFYEVTEQLLCKLTAEISPEGIICVCLCIDKTEKINKIYNMSSGDGNFVLLCDRLSDPGNLGAVLRSARAFGCLTEKAPVLLGEGCADLYSQKTLRGSMGAAFSPYCFEQINVKDAITSLRSSGFTVYAAALHHSAVLLTEIDFSEKTAFVIGNEGNGLGDDVIALCDRCALIPMSAGSESLNAAVAASVIMWERFRKVEITEAR